MDRVKTSSILLILIILACITAGCTSSSGPTATAPPKVVALVGTPTPVPTEPPEPTQGPTWTPTPTPVPPKVTLSDFQVTVTINGDTQKWTGDPNNTGQINAQYATRQDTVTFNVQNTGSDTLENCYIAYTVVTDMTSIGNGQTVSTPVAQNRNYTLGTFKPGDSQDVSLKSPTYSAMLQANVTVTAKWDGGSLVLYKTTLKTDFSSGTTYSPANSAAVVQYGAAY